MIVIIIYHRYIISIWKKQNNHSPIIAVFGNPYQVFARLRGPTRLPGLWPPCGWKLINTQWSTSGEWDLPLEAGPEFVVGWLSSSYKKNQKNTLCWRNGKRVYGEYLTRFHKTGNIQYHYFLHTYKKLWTLYGSFLSALIFFRRFQIYVKVFTYLLLLI